MHAARDGDGDAIISFALWQSTFARVYLGLRSQKIAFGVYTSLKELI